LIVLQNSGSSRMTLYAETLQQVPVFLSLMLNRNVASSGIRK